MRTEKMRDQFADGQVTDISLLDDDDEIWNYTRVGSQVRLRGEMVSEMLDDLASMVETTDHRIWYIAWDAPRSELEEIEAILLGPKASTE
ncbi:hypothetical protein [Streptosporangium sp. NPDC002607]